MRQSKIILIIFLLFLYNLSIVYPLKLGGKFGKKGQKTNLKKILKKDVESKQQAKVEEYKASNLKVAFIPFDYTSEVEKLSAEVAVNELAISMLLNNAFQPFSIKKWLDESYKDKQEKNIMAIVKKAQEVKLPVDYICHGMIFKAGSKFGLIVALYPLDKEKYPSYYYRDFVNFYSLKKITDKIVIEMIKRAETKQAPLFDRKVFINRFNIKFTKREKNKNGEIQEYSVDSIDANRVTYKGIDNFFNELLLYNFHISKIFDVENNNMRKYVDQNPYIITPELEDNKTTRNRKVLDKDSEEAKIDYIISGDIEIIKEGIKKPKTKFTIKVTNNNIRNFKTLFYKEYYFDTLNLDSLYQNMREYSKHIMLTLLDSEERKKVGEVSIDSYYGSDEMFINDTYLGWGDQPNLLLPLDVTDIDTVFYKNWKKETNINILPFDINKPKRPFFKMSIGLMLLSRLLLHPVYNENADIQFGDDDSLIFNANDIYTADNINIQFNPLYHLSTQHGLGIDFSLESKYFGISSSVAVIIGECFRYKQIDADGPINIDNTNIENFESRYEIDRLSVITDFNILFCGILLPTDWRVRIYGGIGFFNALWYNNLTERIYGEGIIDDVFYEFENVYSNRASLFFSLGVFPEVGLIYKFLRFNFKVGIAYYFDLYKYTFFSQTRNSSYDTFNTSNVAVKISCGYYLN